MLEDEIQYLGTWTAPRVNTIPPWRGPCGPSVEGVVLRIESSSEFPGCEPLTFLRSLTTTVDIGRRPSSDDDRPNVECDSSSAMFRCAVISRKHARITFADSGQVYLMDLNSHHGTHVLKPGQTVSNAINPESSVLLDQGDVVTFGKSVGCDKQLVKPVTVRVELIHDATRISPLPPIDVLDPSSEPTKESASERRNSSCSPRGSGRYGVYVPPSVSSDDGDGSSSRSGPDPDSDIEEIPPPSIPKLTSVSTGNSSSRPFGMNSLNLLRHLLPPVHKPSTPPLDFSSYFPSPPHAELSFSTPHITPLESPYSHHNEYDVHKNDVCKHKGEVDDGSESSMDLGSPSPAPAGESWLISRSSSPISQPPAADTASDKAAQSDAVTNDDVNTTITVVAGTPAAGIVEKGTVSQHDGGGEVGDLKSTLERIRADLTKLQVHKRKYRARFNQNARTIAGKLHDLEERQTSLSDHVDDVTEDLQGQVDGLQDQVDDMTPAVKDDTTKAIEDLRSAAAMAIELGNVREKAEKAEREITAEIEAVKAARLAAISAIEAEQALPTSLKRKRSVLEDADASGVDVVSGGTTTDVGGVPVTKRPRTKARRILRAVVQTTTAVTIGAAVTWSALAFS